MKQLFKFSVLLLLISFLKSCKEVDSSVASKNTNYGYNIVIAFDLSNRILRNGSYEDPEILNVVLDNLKAAFQKSIDVGINPKFYITTINKEDFKEFNYSDSIFRIDLTKFKNDAVSRADYLHHNDNSTNSFRHNTQMLGSTFLNFYNQLKTKPQRPADVWYFFQNQLTLPIIDTSSFTYERDGSYITSKYKNYIIIVTDGYIEAGRYSEDKTMRDGNMFGYFSENRVKEFRADFINSGQKDILQFYKEKKYGIKAVSNNLLQDCKVLVLELDDRSVVNGTTTATPTDAEILKLFWGDWLLKSGISKENIVIKEKLPNKQYLNKLIQDFLEIK